MTNNQAEKYQDIDTKIEETYGKDTDVKNQNQKYDMYKRFLRWASDRIKNSGMVVFVSNNSFLNAKSNDGLRRSVFEEFDYIYTVNLKGDARLSGDAWKRQGGKIFGSKARVGIAISFFIKTGEDRSEIYYNQIDDYMKREEKLKWLANNSLSTLQLEQIIPDEDANWLNQTDNDFDKMVPILNEKYSIFRLSSLGVTTQRDEWVFNFDKKLLGNKMKYFIDLYNKTLEKYLDEKPVVDFNVWVDKKIKWSDDLIKKLKREIKLTYQKTNIIPTMYRPFVQKFQFFDEEIIDRSRKFSRIFKNNNSNKMICFSKPNVNVLFHALAAKEIVEYSYVKSATCIPFYIYGENSKHSNVSRFGLALFNKHYKTNNITDEDIFYYTYAIFNDPKYQEKYKYNLQRKFPRIPLAENFNDWVKIGKKLYELHVGFKDVEPYPLKRIDKKTTRNNTKLNLKKSKKIEREQENSSESIEIIIDDKTILAEIPKEALQYKFSSKCALEWILKFYKESKNMVTEESCNNLEVMKKFNTYKFADHKEQVIDLLQKVTTVSVETMSLRRELQKMPWGKQPELNLSKDSQGEKKIKNIKTKSKTTKPKKASKKSKRTSGLQDSLDGAGQKRLF